MAAETGVVTILATARTESEVEEHLATIGAFLTDNVTFDADAS